MSDVPPGSNPQGWAAPPPQQSPGWNPPGAGVPGGGGPGQPANGMGVAALVVGIIALVVSWVPFLGLGLAVFALIFGILGLNKAKRREASNQGMAVAGVVLGGIALLIGLLFTILGVALFSSDEFRDLTDCIASADTDADRANCRDLFEQDLDP